MTARDDAAARVGTPVGTAAQGRTTRGRRTMRRSALAAAALHGVALLLLLPRPPGPATMPPEPPPVEVELVRRDDAAQGAPAPSETPPAPPAAPPAAPSLGHLAETPPAPSTPPEPERADAGVPPQAAPPPAARAAPAVNLGDAEAERAALTVTGIEGVIPPRPDATHRNLPPTYPADAARRGRQGTVGLLVQVDEFGSPAEVRIVRRSGTPSLDRAARDAVLLWRFTPARIDGVPAAFSYPVEMHFKLGDR